MASVVTSVPDAFGSAIGVAGNERAEWAAATTNVVALVADERVEHVIAVTGYRAGRPSFTPAGLRVGGHLVDLATGTATPTAGDRRWLVEELDEGSGVRPADFALATVAPVPDASLAAIRSLHLPPRGRARGGREPEPTSQLLLVDLDADALVAVLARDASSMGDLVDASSSVVAAVARTSVSTWASTNGAPLGSWSGEHVLDALAVDPASPRVATVDRTGVAEVREPDGTVVWRWRSHDGRGAATAWSPDGTQLATATADGHVRIWAIAVEPPQVLDEWRGPPVGGLAFGPTAGRLIVAGTVVDRHLTILSIDS